jgi:hypothetical protein
MPEREVRSPITDLKPGTPIAGTTHPISPGARSSASNKAPAEKPVGRITPVCTSLDPKKR